LRLCGQFSTATYRHGGRQPASHGFSLTYKTKDGSASATLTGWGARLSATAGANHARRPQPPSAPAGAFPTTHRLQLNKSLAQSATRRFHPAMTRPPQSSARAFELYDDRMPVRRYKLLLQAFLKRRGPGTRQAIAEALGNTRSFITQITSPAYDMAIPPQHVRTIIRLAALPPEEERTFLDAYLTAHPERATELLGRGDGRTITITLPHLASPAAQARLEALIERFARETAALMLEQQAELLHTSASAA